MPRKLKTYVTTSGFFEVAVAAPSMKAATELLQIRPSAFTQGFAHETDETAIIDTTMDKPGVVLRRAVGSKGKFVENAELPKLAALQDAMTHKRVEQRRVVSAGKKVKTARPKTTDTAAGRKAAQLYDLAEKRRQKEQERAEAQREKERQRQERATEKAQAALGDARAEHEARAADLQKQREAVDRRIEAEDERWDEEETKLKATLRRVEQE